MEEASRGAFAAAHEILGVTLENASEAQLRGAFIAAFASDLPLGFARVGELVEKLRTKQHRVMLTLGPPRSPFEAGRLTIVGRADRMLGGWKTVRM